ncbi:hypothetical protein ACO0R3_002841 [Hanseniaspora guilliermondii]
MSFNSDITLHSSISQINELNNVMNKSNNTNVFDYYTNQSTSTNHQYLNNDLLNYKNNMDGMYADNRRYSDNISETSTLYLNHLNNFNKAENSKLSVNNVVRESKELLNNKTNKSLFKTELCTKFILTNQCPYNDKCQFAHGIRELNVRTVNKKFKTKLCKKFSKTGYCRYGDRCQFKHGTYEDHSQQSDMSVDSCRHLYVREDEIKDTNNNKNWVANVKYIGKVNNW